MGGTLIRSLALAASLLATIDAAIEPAQCAEPTGTSNSAAAPINDVAGNQTGGNFQDRGFLPNFLRDVLAVVGVIGVVATLIALGLAWHQVQQATLQSKHATSVAKAATDAAVAALSESRKKYNRHIISRANKMVSQASVYVNESNWTCASLRLNDIHDNLTEIAVDDTEWQSLASRLQKMETAFSNLPAGSDCSKPTKSKWIILKTDLQTKINKFNSPFALPEQEP